jgi:hypothetical protein
MANRRQNLIIGLPHNNGGWLIVVANNKLIYQFVVCVYTVFNEAYEVNGHFLVQTDISVCSTVLQANL